MVQKYYKMKFKQQFAANIKIDFTTFEYECWCESPSFGDSNQKCFKFSSVGLSRGLYSLFERRTRHVKRHPASKTISLIISTNALYILKSVSWEAPNWTWPPISWYKSSCVQEMRTPQANAPAFIVDSTTCESSPSKISLSYPLTARHPNSQQQARPAPWINVGAKAAPRGTNV